MTLLVLFNQFLIPAGRRKRRTQWELQRALLDQRAEVTALEAVVAVVRKADKPKEAIRRVAVAAGIPVGSIPRTSLSKINKRLTSALKRLYKTEARFRAVRKRHEDEALTVLLLSA